MNAYPAAIAWHIYMKQLLAHGVDTHNARTGQDTREILQASAIYAMTDAFPWHPGRKASRRFAAGEALWILEGRNDVPSIARYNKRIARYSDDGETFFGAYGPRIHAQLGYVVNKLAEDPSSRQAVINIWRENPPYTKDVPCTISLVFMIRQGLLHLHVYMRSSDAWLGVPYDWFNYAMVATQVALRLRACGTQVKLGLCFWTAASGHLYAPDMGPAREATDMAQVRSGAYSKFFLEHLEGEDHLLDVLRSAAESGEAPAWPGP